MCNAERAFDGRTGDDVYGPFARGSGKVGRGNRRAGVEHIVLGGVVFGAFQAIDCGKSTKKRLCDRAEMGFVLRAAIDFGGSIFVQKIFS